MSNRKRPPRPNAQSATDEGGTGTPGVLDAWGNLEKEISSVRAERDRVVAEADAHRAELAERERSVAALQSEAATLRDELAIMRRRLEERTAAFDGHSPGRGGAERRLADYRDALLGMEHTLAERDQTIRQHAAEKAQFAARIAELERQCAELTGRWREAEAANARIQAMLTDAARGAERLDGEARQWREQTEALQREAEKQSARAAELEAALGSRSRESSRRGEVERELKTEKERGTRLATQLRERSDRLAALEEELKAERLALAAARKAQAAAEKSQAAAEKSQAAAASKTGGERQAGKALRAELAEARESLTQRDSRIAELEARAAQLTSDAAATENVAGLAVAARDRMADELQQKLAAIAELEKRVAGLDAELEARCEALAQAESEIRRHQNAIAVMGREVERRDDVEASARRQDDLMARHGPAQEDTGSRRRVRIIVSLEGEHTIRYPLYKPAMIIGRSSDADIHIIGRFTSRRHARVVITDDDSAVIEDLGSLNGIRVNDEIVTRHILQDGDMLDIGGARLQFVDLGERDDAAGMAG
jgi:chromosome segregation ATPase